MKKLLSKTDTENVIVHAIFKNIPGKKCECIGVLMRDDKDGIEVAFNALEDRVIDSINISRSRLLSLKVVDEKSIMVLR